MGGFSVHTGLVIPFDRSNIDTDAIVPKQYLKMLEKTGFGDFLFDDERYLDPGMLKFLSPSGVRIPILFLITRHIITVPSFCPAQTLAADRPGSTPYGH